ncbi:MAG: hypothetical protein HFF05_03425 [Oscillospiraceae bacterium]|nr:hypothetical protein [Oscillospiraceae bacterium]
MEEQEKTCETCKHFCRHYSRRSRNKFIPLAVGHCINPHLRDKRSDTPACQRYAKGRVPDAG